MKIHIVLVLSYIFIGLHFVAADDPRNKNVSAKQYVIRAERAVFPPNYYGEFEVFTVQKGGGERKMAFNIYHKESTGSFLKATAPRRLRGTRFLKKGNTLRMYNPYSRSERAVKLSMRQSFQGTIFSNRDIGTLRYADNYSFSWAGTDTMKTPTGSGSSGGRTVECNVIEGKAKSPESSYGRIRLWISVRNTIPLKIEFYSKSNVLMKTMTTEKIGQLGGRLRPVTMKMVSHTQEGAYSRVRIRKLEPRESLDDSMFTVQHLTSVDKSRKRWPRPTPVD